MGPMAYTENPLFIPLEAFTNQGMPDTPENREVGSASTRFHANLGAALGILRDTNGKLTIEKETLSIPDYTDQE